LPYKLSSDNALVGVGIFSTHLAFKSISFHTKPGVNLAHWEKCECF